MRARTWLLGLSLLTASVGTAQAPTTATYTVHAMGANTVAGEIPLEITLLLAAPPGERTVLEIPVWTPGSYRLRDFPERITPLAAKADAREVPIERLSRTSWQVRHEKVATLEFRYRVALHPDDRFMDPEEKRRCLTYEGPAVYVFARGLQQVPCTVHFELPEGWSHASGLEGHPDGTCTAPDYDVLADCPVKLGVFQKFGFESHGAQVEVVLDAGEELQFDHAAWLKGLAAIVDNATDVFGVLPVPRYVFLYTASRLGGGGGLEHLDCTAIGVSRARLKNDPSSSFGISSHEFFHCWNVKRLRPIELGPFLYDRANRTTGLWLSEGVTSYYGDLVLARAGLTTRTQFWQGMAGAISNFESTPGRHFVSSEQASLRVWDKEAPDRRVDYYTSGKVLGLLLDLEIRHATGNQKSLDDAMLAMWRACEAQHRGLTGEEIVAICSQVASVDLGWFFDAHVSGTAVPDYARFAGFAGLEYHASAQRQETVLRGMDLAHKDAPAFSDYEAIEHSGGGDVLGNCGKVRSLEGEAIKTSSDVERIVQAAAEKGAKSLKVEFEMANGVARTVSALLESRTRWKVELVPKKEPELEQRIGEALTAPKKH